MGTIKEQAQAYKPQSIKNIAELERVSVDMKTETRTFKAGTAEEYVADVAIIDGTDYRIPKSVFKQLQIHLLQKPGLTFFKVIRTGEGVEGTRYTVVPLEVIQ